MHKILEIAFRRRVPVILNCIHINVIINNSIET